MTQTPRDWQKDMEMCGHHVQPLVFAYEAREALPYWLQEAKKWREEALRQYPTPEAYEAACAALEKHRARADAAEEEARYQKGVTDDYAKGYRLQELRATAAEAREQRLKEELEGALRFIGRTEHIPEETVAGFIRAHFSQALSALYPDTPAQPPAPTPEITARSIDDWHEDYGDVLWWTFPIQEPPYCGSPLDSNWPDYHTHWTPLVLPAAPAPKEGN